MKQFIIIPLNGSLLSISSGLRVSVSNASGATQWRKESVTIIESQEPMEEDGEENEGDVESDGVERDDDGGGGGGVGRGRGDHQFLSVPCQTITASSSAETLTDNTLTAPSTPTRSRVGSDPADESDGCEAQTKIIRVLL